MIENNNTKVFFELLKAGLWGKDVQLSQYRDIDFLEVYRLAKEQSVIGLVAEGLEKVTDEKAPQSLALTLAGAVLQLEQRNTAMNTFIASLVEKMRSAEINTLLVKGQGVAQCYNRPLWRTCGDVDFFLDNDNYEKAKKFLKPLASEVEKENEDFKHLGMIINGWVVELHGHLYCGLSSRVDRGLDEMLNETFYSGNVRSWDNNGSQIFMLGKENDIVYVFVHFLNHYYREGVGLRQICDWCRLLWTYRDEIDVRKIEKRIQNMGLVLEWKVFAAYIVEYLGMPAEVMPMYSDDKKLKRKAKFINNFILSVGNMGHNRDSSYMEFPYFFRKCYSAKRRICDLVNHARIFPMDSLRFFPNIMLMGVKCAMRGR